MNPKHPWTRLPLLSLLLLSACDPVWSVSGRAYRCDNDAALEGVSVTLELTWGSGQTRRADAVTGPDGHFQLQVIAEHNSPGTLTLSKPGYVGAAHEYRKMPPRDESISLCLTPME